VDLGDRGGGGEMVGWWGRDGGVVGERWWVGGGEMVGWWGRDGREVLDTNR
jgi:hypothetical protein